MNDSYRRILAIEDISCVGQCSLTAALPVLSVCGMETVIMPSTILSTHTGGFKNYFRRDLTDDMKKIAEHWKMENILFDAFLTGYLGNIKQIDCVKAIIDSLGKTESIVITDPAMADNGKFYSGFDFNYANILKTLLKKADYILPNITEACILTDTTYTEEYDEEYINGILAKINKITDATVILTGVGYEHGKTGVLICNNNHTQYYGHEKINAKCNGTGDLFASAFSGAILNGIDKFDAVKIAADFVLESIKATAGDDKHWYGVKFEKALPGLIKAVNNEKI